MGGVACGRYEVVLLLIQRDLAWLWNLSGKGTAAPVRTASNLYVVWDMRYVVCGMFGIERATTYYIPMMRTRAGAGFTASASTDTNPYNVICRSRAFYL